MLHPSSPWRKRPRGRFVLKYLEGIPTPTKLVDHIAGADLSSSSWTDFLSTVPRYINAQHEQRLSRLFFHHVLYPAGGARRPYQAVVVRGGRLVAPSPVVVDVAASTHTPVEHGGASVKSATPPTATKTKTTTKAGGDPLAVPEVWRHATTSTSTPSSSLLSSSTPLSWSMPTAQQWARADPARQSYFFSSSSPSTRAAQASPRASAVAANSSGGGGGDASRQGGRFDFEMGQPRFLTWHAPASSPSSSSPLPRSTSQRPAPLVENTARGSGGNASGTAPMRATTDDAFRGLTGVVEGFWKSYIQSPETPLENTAPNITSDAVTETKEPIEAALARHLVNPSGGVLLFGRTVNHDGVAVPHEVPVDVVLSASKKKKTELAGRGGDGDEREALVQALLTAAAAAAAPNNTTASRHPTGRDVCLQTRLPAAAFAHIWTTAPLNSTSDRKGTPEKVRVSRVAGGVVPSVSFAVGQLLTTRSITRDEADKAVSDAFAHLTAVVRVRVRPTRAAPSLSPQSHSSSVPPAVVPHISTSTTATHERGGTDEPWRLGHPLDPSVPYVARTVTEKNAPMYVRVQSRATAAPTVSVDGGGGAGGAGGGESGAAADTACYECVLGRVDAECYLIPQRELLLELLVPEETRKLCRVQNGERLARQARLGHGDGRRPQVSHDNTDEDDWDFAWPADQRPNAARLARGRFLNAQEANAASSHGPTPLRRSPDDAAAQTTATATTVPQLNYEVRALPGDVIFIPRRWGYRVKRIIGSSVLDASSPSPSVDGGAVKGTQGVERRRIRVLTPSNSPATRVAPESCVTNAFPAAASASSSPSASASSPLSSGSPNIDDDVDGAAAVDGSVVSVEVDAWCLAYAPYPDLTAAQADVYVSANYVHHGLDEFYRKGGNNVFHAYE